MPSDWTPSLGNGGAIGTVRGAEEADTGIKEAGDTSQGTRGRPQGTTRASDDSTHAADGTSYAGTNEDVSQSNDNKVSKTDNGGGHFSGGGASKGRPNVQYGHDAKAGHKSGDVASVELMREVEYASGGQSLSSPMGAAITSLMRSTAGEIKMANTTLSATGSEEGRTTKSKQDEEEQIFPGKELTRKEKETKSAEVKRCGFDNY